MADDPRPRGGAFPEFRTPPDQPRSDVNVEDQGTGTGPYGQEPGPFGPESPPDAPLPPFDMGDLPPVAGDNPLVPTPPGEPGPPSAPEQPGPPVIFEPGPPLVGNPGPPVFFERWPNTGFPIPGGSAPNELRTNIVEGERSFAERRMLEESDEFEALLRRGPTDFERLLRGPVSRPTDFERLLRGPVSRGAPRVPRVPSVPLPGAILGDVFGIIREREQRERQEREAIRVLPQAGGAPPPPISPPERSYAPDFPSLPPVPRPPAPRVERGTPRQPPQSPPGPPPVPRSTVPQPSPPAPSPARVPMPRAARPMPRGAIFGTIGAALLSRLRRQPSTRLPFSDFEQVPLIPSGTTPTPVLPPSAEPDPLPIPSPGSPPSGTPVPSPPSSPEPFPSPLTSVQTTSLGFGSLDTDCECPPGRKRPPLPSDVIADVKVYRRRMSQHSLNNLRRGKRR